MLMGQWPGRKRCQMGPMTQTKPPELWLSDSLTTPPSSRAPPPRHESPSVTACQVVIITGLLLVRLVLRLPPTPQCALTWRSRRLPKHDDLEPPPSPPRQPVPFPCSHRDHHHHHAAASTTPPEYRDVPPTPGHRTQPPQLARSIASSDDRFERDEASRRGRRERGRRVRPGGPDRPQEPRRAAGAPPRPPRGAGRVAARGQREPPRRVRQARARGGAAAGAAPSAAPGGLGDRPRQARHQRRHRPRHVRHRPPRRLRRPGRRWYFFFFRPSAINSWLLCRYIRPLGADQVFFAVHDHELFDEMACCLLVLVSGFFCLR